MIDTIFALATVPGRSGVAVIRVSGPQAVGGVSVLAGSLPAEGRSLRRLVDGQGVTVDEALILVFPEGRSFTGESVVEIQCHGSIAVVRRLLQMLGEQPGFRPAEAGEFTRRALVNGRLDLAQVEGLADLVEAETEAQRRQAMRIFDGDLGRLVDAWRSRLIRAAALVEATIDFADEEVPVDVRPEVEALLALLIQEMKRELDGVRTAERLRHGFEVAIIGKPNVGKSTLLNRLAGREVAITSEYAGTTRDIIEVRLDLGGIPVTFLDTAGLRTDVVDPVEAIGIERARKRAADADLRVILLEQGDDVPVSGDDDIVVIGKSDTMGGVGGVSGLTGQGVDALLSEIEARLSLRMASIGVAVRERHAVGLRSAVGVLSGVLQRIDRIGDFPELVAQDIRDVLTSVDSLIGRVGVEDFLDEIFASFCIGK